MRLRSVRSQTRNSHEFRYGLPAGFTLVELLVALGLVSLIMLLFAQVFQIATETMSRQRGIMENDQRARTLSTILKHDLDNRTMRTVTPYQPGELVYAGQPIYAFSYRQGYLSISEGEPSQDTDVLAFTTLLPVSDEPYYGKATALANLQAHPNQPDADDYVTYNNSVGNATEAEVVYFLRNGNLYRRVLLIRDPIDKSRMDRQPRDGFLGTGNDMFDPTLATPYYPLGSDFWKDFDFSARFQTALGGARFIGGGSAGLNPLDNGTGAGVFPIGIPFNRFGHDPDPANANSSATPSSVGNPREFVGTLYIGRLTHEETSHQDFNFPHALSAVNDAYNAGGVPTTPINDGNPMKFIGVGTNPLADTNNNGVVDQFERGSRRGEDILLSNVHGFDVKAWDEIIGDYVDFGHALQSSLAVDGDLNQNRNRRRNYGPLNTNTNRMFDTWHPNFDADNSGLPVVANDGPPFLPKIDYTSYPSWTTGQLYNAGDRVVPTNSTVETFYYQCIQAGTSGATQPAPWPTNQGQTVTDGGVVWQAVYNLKRIRSLRITVRYLDVSSDQMRQVTLIQSLMK